MYMQQELPGNLMDCQEKYILKYYIEKKILPKTFKNLFKIDVCKEMAIDRIYVALRIYNHYIL